MYGKNYFRYILRGIDFPAEFKLFPFQFKPFPAKFQPFAFQFKPFAAKFRSELSINKCKHLHICKLRQCHVQLKTTNFPITTVDNIKILGIFFNSSYTWKHHTQHLQTSLQKKMNIIKCLASRKFNCSINTL